VICTAATRQPCDEVTRTVVASFASAGECAGVGGDDRLDSGGLVRYRIREFSRNARVWFARRSFGDVVRAWVVPGWIARSHARRRRGSVSRRDGRRLSFSGCGKGIGGSSGDRFASGGLWSRGPVWSLLCDQGGFEHYTRKYTRFDERRFGARCCRCSSQRKCPICVYLEDKVVDSRESRE